MKHVRKTYIAGLLFAVTAGSAVAAPAGKLSWFSDTRFAGAGAVGVAETRLLSPVDYKSFDIDLYRSSAADEAYPRFSRPVAEESDSVRFYGEMDADRPALGAGLASELVPTRRNNVFGIQWKHHVNALNSFAVSAEYGENTALNASPIENFDTRAAVSWTSRLPSSIKPSITGSVFLGDEMAREDVYRNLGRKYYGFSVGGSLTLFQSHTPYVSFKMQRNLYDTPEQSSLVTAPRATQRSLLSAGWKWQVQRDISLQAEASYGLGDSSSLDPYTLERSRIIFGTRFDFK